MKRFAILLTVMAFSLGAYAQKCSMSSSSCNTTCKSDSKTYVVTKDCSSKESSQQKRRRYERVMVMAGAGLHFLPKNSTYAVNGRIGGSNQPDMMRNWNGQGMIGIRYGMHGTRRANVLGVFGDLGSLNGASLNRLFNAQTIYQDVPMTSQNEFRSLEAGFLFKEWFRLSGGMGYQSFVNTAQQPDRLNYYTATTGVYIPLGRRLTWTTTATAYFGGDFDQLTIRPTTGLALRFKALRM